MSKRLGSQTVPPSSTFLVFAMGTTTVSSILDHLNSADEVIDDTDQRVVYSGSWVQNLSDAGVPSRTSHYTIVQNSSLTLNFSGTGIDVLGVASMKSQVIQALYVIDGNYDGGQIKSVSGSEINVVGQTFFSVRGLSPGQQHSLGIKVGSGVDPRRYVIDSFVVSNDSGTGVGAGSTAMTRTGTTSALSFTPTEPSSGASAHFSASGAHSMSTGEIAGVVVRCLVGFVLLVTLIITLCRRSSIGSRPTPEPDPTPYLLFTARHSRRRSRGAGGEKDCISERPQPPRRNVNTSTPPDPPPYESGDWVNSSGPDSNALEQPTAIVMESSFRPAHPAD